MPPSATLAVDQSINITVLAMGPLGPIENLGLNFTSSNTTVGTVSPPAALTDSNGIVNVTFTALAAGNTDVTAISPLSGATNKTHVTVIAPRVQIKLSPSSATLNVSETQIFNATAVDDKNNTISGIKITFTSSNTTVGTVAPSSALTGPDGNASVTFTAMEAGVAFVNATNASASVNGSANVTVTIPVVQTGSISGMKFNDLNNNSLKDAGEPGIADWTIKLTKPDETTVNMNTDASGGYNFTNLPAGTYTVAEVLQAGWRQTFPSTGTYTIDLASGQNVMDKDFGNFKIQVKYVFDTGQSENPYPSIMGTHKGTITPNKTILVHKMYTYPCTGTGGHTEYIRFYGNSLNVTKTWNGYSGDYHNIFFDPPITLEADIPYNYEIRTGSYPQIIHEQSLPTANGTINCTQFTDANGKIYYDWIPAIRLE